MSNSNIWDVDLLAARGLIAALNVEVGEDVLNQVAGSFSAHRRNACEWAAQRAHRHLVNSLETASMREFQHRNDEWAEGFRFAEQCLLEQTAADCLGLPPASTPSKGQILRNMVRMVKQDSLPLKSVG